AALPAVALLLAGFDSINPRPAQALFGSCARAVFAPDPFAVAETIERGEDLGIVHLALVGLAPRRHRRDLHMADERQMFLEPPNEIAADDLGVIEVELDAYVRPLPLGDEAGRLLGAGEEIVRPVARIDRLDQQRDVFLLRGIGDAREIPDEGRLRGRPLLRRHLAGEAMDLAAADGG